jgi:haloalkane dehalogenase
MTTESPKAALAAATEHRIPSDRGNVHVRDFAGSAPAFLLLHGFPDNSHIYDDLIPYLMSAGRRAVAIVAHTVFVKPARHVPLRMGRPSIN